MTVRFEFFFDISSPWTWLAFHNVQPLAERLGVAVIWRPILVGGVFNAINPSVYEFRKHPVPAKARYVAKDLTDWAAASGLLINWPPSVFPLNSARLMRACLVADDHGVLPDFAGRAFAAYWTGDRDISQDAELTRLAEAAGLDGPATLEMTRQPAQKERLRANTTELIDRGGFGSPTMFVDGGDMYFGNDRLCLVERALSARLSPPG